MTKFHPSNFRNKKIFNITHANNVFKRPTKNFSLTLRNFSWGSNIKFPISDLVNKSMPEAWKSYTKNYVKSYEHFEQELKDRVPVSKLLPFWPSIV